MSFDNVTSLSGLGFFSPLDLLFLLSQGLATPFELAVRLVGEYWLCSPFVLAAFGPVPSIHQALVTGF
jgi:hypothetical protein